MLFWFQQVALQDLSFLVNMSDVKNSAFSWLAAEAEVEVEEEKKLEGPITVENLLGFLLELVGKNPAAASLPVQHVEFGGLRQVVVVEAFRDSVVIS